MTKLEKTRLIESLLIEFHGSPLKLQQIATQIDILGEMIEEDRDAYLQLVKASETVLDPNRIEETLGYMAMVEKQLLEDMGEDSDTAKSTVVPFVRYVK